MWLSHVANLLPTRQAKGLFTKFALKLSKIAALGVSDEVNQFFILGVQLRKAIVAPKHPNIVKGITNGPENGPKATDFGTRVAAHFVQKMWNELFAEKTFEPGIIQIQVG